MSWWILLLVLCSQYCQNSANSCNSTQYEINGRCCSLCSPGQRIHKECTESRDAECLKCSDGSYQDKPNRETSCLSHSDCNEELGFVMIQEGSIDRNVDCQCQEGRHCSSPACENCVYNTVCHPGQGVIQRANRSLDTLCAPCSEGTFSNITSDTEPCINWKICKNSQQELRQGTPTSDVVCGPHQANYTWLYVVLFLALVICVAAIFLFIRRRRKMPKKVMENQYHENSPEKIDQPLAQEHQRHNLPVEDQDITMQGLPVAQEQGKDYHMSQEEV